MQAHLSLAKQLVFHGGVILLVGLLCGAPYGRAIVRGKPEAVVRAWRVAHASLSMGGILLIALAAAVPQLQLSGFFTASMVWAFVVSSYAFAAALPLGAHYGHRGLTFKPPFLNRVVYAGNVVGAIGSLVGAVLLVWGAYAAL
jgi:hypothetical protein